MNKLKRRELVTGLLAAGASLLAGRPSLSLAETPGGPLGDPPPLAERVYLPLVAYNAPRPWVVHVRDSRAAHWNGTGFFYDAVDQNAVDRMVLTGLQILTGASDWAEIWRVLFSRVRSGGYQPGQKIAIKVNLNNSARDGNSCSYHNNLIDALPQPVLALLSGMVAAGVRPSDVIIYDAVRLIPAYFREPIRAQYAGVSFIGTSSCPNTARPTFGKDPSLTVHFSHPEGNLKDRALSDVLYDATYVINMPILKRHGGDGWIPVTLGFKNHLGSLERIGGAWPDDLHSYLTTGDPLYQDRYSPLVDIYANTNIRDKTVLTVGDGLYGSFHVVAEAQRSWRTFGGQAPSSLFFSTDPVALDCVMADFLVAEGLVSRTRTYDYLFCAMKAGLGICEGSRENPGGDPWREPYGSGYSQIAYMRIDL